MPEALPPYDAIPDVLLDYEQWLCWREEDRDGKATKVPIDPTTGAFASTTDPETWSSFETASERARTGDETGVGFVFTEDDPFVGVDLDDCRVPATGTVSAWADDIVDRLDSFTEVSPSGTGFHVLLRGEIPGDRNRKGDIELYETGRFFTVTGDHVEGTPTAIKERDAELAAVYEEYVREEPTSRSGPEAATANPSQDLDDDELVRRAKAAANGDKFERLWRGSTAGYESHSEADMALCALLAFWTGGDARWMDALFRASGLMREKWDEPHFGDGSTYGEKTIERAIGGTSAFYDPTASQSDGDEPDPEAAIDFEGIRTREADRLDRIADLEQRISRLLNEKEELQTELERERDRRRELEAELAERGGSDGWLSNLL